MAEGDGWVMTLAGRVRIQQLHGTWIATDENGDELPQFLTQKSWDKGPSFVLALMIDKCQQAFSQGRISGIEFQKAEIREMLGLSRYPKQEDR